MSRTYRPDPTERTRPEADRRRYCDGCGRRGRHPDCDRLDFDYSLDGPPELDRSPRVQGEAPA